MHSTPMPLMSVRSSLAFSCSLVMGDTSVLWFWVLWPMSARPDRAAGRDSGLLRRGTAADVLEDGAGEKAPRLVGGRRLGRMFECPAEIRQCSAWFAWSAALACHGLGYRLKSSRNLLGGFISGRLTKQFRVFSGPEEEVSDNDLIFGWVYKYPDFCLFVGCNSTGNRRLFDRFYPYFQVLCLPSGSSPGSGGFAPLDRSG